MSPKAPYRVNCGSNLFIMDLATAIEKIRKLSAFILGDKMTCDNHINSWGYRIHQNVLDTWSFSAMMLD
jgi:hypothetical protein